ncbi:hypothetical protein GN958_ATG08870, partial [Phytophthora infestans]
RFHKSSLLSMIPLLIEQDENLSARKHCEFLAEMLLRNFGKQLVFCLLLVGDSCAVGRLLATLMSVPLIGYSSHRLGRLGEDLSSIQALLRVLKQAAKLRLKTSPRPVTRQNTHGSSAFECYIATFSFLNTSIRRLENVRSVSKAQNGSSVFILQDVR